MPTQRKARGAFFTPPAIADYVVDWTVRDREAKAFEPSCGEAVFMLALGHRLRALGADGHLAGQLHGVDLHDPSARAAKRKLDHMGFGSTITVTDFFDREPTPIYDAVVGNPPYVRYQDFSGDARAKAQAAALGAGVRVSGLASSWAPFVVQAVRHLRPGGRLGLVLPAELLSVNYAGPVRRFLMERFERVRLVVFDERVFPGVLEEVVLALAEGEGPTSAIEVQQGENLAALDDRRIVRWSPPTPEAKWTPALLPQTALEAYSLASGDSSFAELEAWGDTDLGMVTGNNGFFTLSAERAAALGLDTSDLLAISPPGSRHLRGVALTREAWEEMRVSEKPVYLFRPEGRPSIAARAYIADGEAKGVHEAYKCRVRDPWWRVPLVRPPDLFLTYMNHHAPRLTANEAGVTYLNSVHGVRLASAAQDLGRTALPIASLNTITLVGAELVGRAYGGGLLKLEPKEADRLPVPSPRALGRATTILQELAARVPRLLEAGELDKAVALVDRRLLVEHLGLPQDALGPLVEARATLFARRDNRAAEPIPA